MATQDVTIWDETNTKAVSVDDREKTGVGLNSIGMSRSNGTYYPQQPDSIVTDGEVYPIVSNADAIPEMRSAVLTDEYSDYEPFAGTSIPAGWNTVIGSGASMSVANSVLTINAGTTANSQSYIAKEQDYMPIETMYFFKISQRIANQTIYVGMTDNQNPSLETMFARFRFDGTDATKCYCEVQSSADSGATEGTTTLRTMTISTANYGIYAIMLAKNRVTFLTGADINSLTEIITYSNQMPHPYSIMNVRVRVLNGSVAPLSNTVISVDTISVHNINKVDITNSFISEPIASQIIGYDGTVLRPVSVDIYGNLKTSATPSTIGASITRYASLAIAGSFPTTVLTYTVTTGKKLYVYSYHLQATGQGTAIATLKVNGTTVMTYENPGGSAGLQQFQFGVYSPLICNAGDIVTVVADTGSSSNKTYKASLVGSEF